MNNLMMKSIEFQINYEDNPPVNDTAKDIPQVTLNTVFMISSGRMYFLTYCFSCLYIAILHCVKIFKWQMIYAAFEHTISLVNMHNIVIVKDFSIHSL